jgi:hypothetical protein
MARIPTVLITLTLCHQLSFLRVFVGKFDLSRTLAKVFRLRRSVYRGLRNTPKQPESGGNMSVQETKSIIGALRLRLQPLNVKEFAWIFRVAEDTALKWIREDRVPAFRLGKTVRIDPHLLADMLQREVSDWEAKQELLDRRLKVIEKEGMLPEKRFRAQQTEQKSAPDSS